MTALQLIGSRDNALHNSAFAFASLGLYLTLQQRSNKFASASAFMYEYWLNGWSATHMTRIWYGDAELTDAVPPSPI
jgi:hypothetical protein